MDVLVFKNQKYTITISTGDISVASKRFRSRLKDAATSYCDYTFSRDGKLWLDYEYGDNKGLQEVASDSLLKSWSNLHPVIFEIYTYQIAINFHNSLSFTGSDSHPKVLHQLKAISQSFNFYKNGEHSGILVGTLDFLNSVGKFKLPFQFQDIEGNIIEDYFDFDVVSPKLDTKNDLKSILSLINQECENYIFDLLTLTYANLTIIPKKNSNKIIWLTIFKQIVESYFRNVKYIQERPNNRPLKTTIFSKPNKIRRWTQIQAERYKELGRDAERYLYRNEYVINTINTRENRFVKYTLHILGRKYHAIISNLLLNNSKLDDSERKLLKYYDELFTMNYNSSFFRRVGSFEGFRQESIILQQREGYRQIYKYWLMLKSSIDLIDGQTNIGIKKIWQLYEFWCFLVMKRLIAKVLGLNLSDPNQVSEDKLITLDGLIEGEKNHCVHFKCSNGDVVNLDYQHTYSRYSHAEMKSTTTEQRPDIVLMIKKSNGFVLTYLYDAKYRLLDDQAAGEVDAGISVNYADYPVPDAINQMHRYRDAIYYELKEDQRPRSKEVIGGYILFPGRIQGDEYKNRYFYQSIEKVNIGAFPLLPSDNEDSDSIIQCDLLEKHLRKILLEDSISAHIKDSIPQKGLTYVPEVEPGISGYSTYDEKS